MSITHTGARVVFAGVLALLASSFTAPSPAAETDGQWTGPERLGAVGQVVQPTYRQRVAPLIEVNAAGDAVAVWMSDRGVRASYRPAGLDWQRPVVVSPLVGELVHASIDDRGRATTSWWRASEEALYVADRTVKGAWRLDTDAPSPGGCCWPSVPTADADASGTLMVTWNEGNDLAPEDDLYWRSRAGEWIHGGFGGGSYRPVTVYDRTATFARGGQGVFLQTIQYGDRASAWELVWPGTSVSEIDLASNARGDLLLAAVDLLENADGTEERRLIAITKPVGEEWRQAFVTETLGARSPSIAIDDNGEVAVAYKNTAEQSLEIRVGRVGGTSTGVPASVSPDLKHADGASLSFNAVGDLVTSWYTGTEDGDRPVYAARRTPEGSWGEPVRIGTRDVGVPAVTAYPNGMFTTLFELNGAVKWADYVEDNVGPRTSMRAPRRDFTRSIRVPVRWVATDDLARPRDTDVRVRSAGRAARLGAWSMWKRRTTDTAARYPGEPGQTYCFSARSRDRVGNLGRWSPRRCSTTPIDDRAFNRTGGWSLNRQAAAYRNTLTVTGDGGQALRLPHVKAKKLRLVARTCPGCGSVRVLHGGRNLGVVDLRTPRARNKVVIPIRSYDRIHGGRISIRVVSTGKPVRIDGLIASR